MYNISKSISKYLNLNMLGFLDKLLHIHLIITKRCYRLTPCRFKSICKFLFFADYSYTFSSTACGSLYYNRIPKIICKFICCFNTVNCTFTSRYYRNSCSLHHLSRIGFVSKCIYNRSIRTNKFDITLFTH